MQSKSLQDKRSETSQGDGYSSDKDIDVTQKKIWAMYITRRSWVNMGGPSSLHVSEFLYGTKVAAE